MDTDFEISKMLWVNWGIGRRRVLAVGSCEGDIEIVGEREGRECALIGHSDVIVELEQAASRLFSSSMDRTVRIWSILDGSALHTLTNNALITAMRATPNGDAVAMTGRDACLFLWSKCGTLLHAYKPRV